MTLSLLSLLLFVVVLVVVVVVVVLYETSESAPIFSCTAPLKH